MAMIFMDGFDYYSATQMTRKWTAVSGPVLQTGVYGNGKAMAFNSASVNLPANYATGLIGFHIFVPSAFTAQTLWQFKDAGTIQVDLRIDATGALFFTRNGTVLGSPSSNRLAANTWYWLEVKVTINSSTGAAEVRVNGTSWLALSAQNTQTSASAFFNQIGNAVGTGAWFWDSFHFWDTTGSLNNTWIGEHAISTLFPNGAGSHTDWTKSGGAANFSQVNENPADDDTSYNFSNTAGQIDSYAMADLVQTAGTIAAVAINTVDRVDDASPHVIHHYYLSSGVAAESPDISPSSGYANHQSIRETDPNTSAAWTIAGVNAMEAGVKLIS